jgi:hydrocephalus-inducing protein
MTSSTTVPEIKEEVHEGTLFFPLPDGMAILYNLIAKSLPPLPISTFDISIKAKKSHIHILPLKNWLKVTQRFVIQWTVEPEDPTIILNGANTFDVSGENTKEYKLTLYGLKPCVSKLTIYFRNEQTKEFMFFRINLTV